MRDVSRTHHRTFESPPSGTAGAIRHFAARHRTQDVQASGAFQQSKRRGAARALQWGSALAGLAVLGLSFLQLISSTANPFIYYRF